MATLKNSAISGSLTLPSGTSAQRPSSPPEGSMRYNTDYNMCEYYYNGAWMFLTEGRGAIPRDGMILELSYDDANSWPGSGTTWYDTSGQNNHFRIASGCPDAGQQAMNFSTNSLNAKYQTNSTDLPGVPGSGGQCTYVCVTRILNSTSQWRTLTRSWNADHHVIIQSGGWDIGMYDNDGSGFLDAGGPNQNQLYGYPDRYMACVWRWQDSDQPTYAFNCMSAQQGIYTGSFNNSNGRYNRGFSVLGGYHSGSNDVTVGSQPWGWIKYFACYNRRLSDDETQLVITAMRARYNI